jgi:transcription-repair coupling factor (superfamily II helicase)
LLDVDKKITSHAKKRLEAIQLLEDLGAGYYLAIHDLEIRGAGELLGDNQSGEIHEIGFNLYIDMLNHAVKQLKDGKALDLNKPLNITKDINIHVPTILPHTYCQNVNERLIIYKRLSNTSNKEQLKELKEELIDRFGLMPDQTKNLILFHELRIDIDKYEILKVDAGKSVIEITFSKEIDIDPIKIINLIQSDQRYKMNGPDKLKIAISIELVEDRVMFVRNILKDLISNKS